MKEVIAKHCDDKPVTVRIEENDKKAFVCEKCHRLFEVNSNGEITKSPLNQTDVDVVLDRGGNVCTGFGGKLGSCLFKVGDVRDQYKCII